MKSSLSVISAFLGNRTSRHNSMLLFRFLAVLVVLIVVYSVLFHVLMKYEKQEHSWLTGVYWTLTVMSTLGFGDITFSSDLGRLFSIVVLMSGMIFLLVLLPFTFIEFFYAPWMRAQANARAPRELPPDTRGHVIMTLLGPLTRALIPMLENYRYRYVVLAPSVTEALELHEQGFNAVVGELDDPETYRRVRVSQAALVVTTRADVVNTNITFTVRALAERIPVIASAESDAARGVLELAGATHVLRLESMMGEALARRVIGTDAVAHTVGEVDGLVIAEANATGTPLVGKTVQGSGLREQVGVSVIGIWEQGRFVEVRPEMQIQHNTAFVLAGTREQMNRYNELMCIYHLTDAPVLVVGGGGVGQAAYEALARRHLACRIIEKDPSLVRTPEGTVIGDAADVEVLQRSGVHEAASLLITTHDDDTNIYLTILCRRLRSDLQIISRCTHERNVATLHRAGADLVLSYGSMGANAVFNLLRRRETLLIAEGLNLFSVRVPESLAGNSLVQSQIRARTGCTVIAIRHEGRRHVNPPADHLLPKGGELLLIGTLENEERFLDAFGTH